MEGLVGNDAAAVNGKITQREDAAAGPGLKLIWLADINPGVTVGQGRIGQGQVARRGHGQQAERLARRVATDGRAVAADGHRAADDRQAGGAVLVIEG